MKIKGLTISDILDMDWETINKMSASDLRAVTSRLVSASNKRIRRLEKTPTGTSSFAYQSVEERGRMFSVKGKSVNQLKNEFKIASNFLRFKTSTVKGWKKYRSKMEKSVSDATYGESQTWSEKTWSKLWKVYRRTEELHGGSFKKGDSDKIQKKLYSIFADSDKRRSVDYFSDKLEDKYNELYESSQSEVKNIQDAFDTEDETEETEM